MPAQWKTLGEQPAVRVRMGDYSPSRVPEMLLQEMWTFARDLGFRPAVTGRLSPGAATAEGVTYTLEVEKISLVGRGLAAEDLTVNVVVPAGASVVRTTGDGYQGVRQDASSRPAWPSGSSGG